MEIEGEEVGTVSRKTGVTETQERRTKTEGGNTKDTSKTQAHACNSEERKLAKTASEKEHKDITHKFEYRSRQKIRRHDVQQ